MARSIKMCFFLLLLPGCICVQGTAASDRKTTSDRRIEAALKRHFHGLNLTLRHPLVSSTQQYDSAGTVLSGGPEGSWTVYGGMKIGKISLDHDKLLLEGNRTYFRFDGPQSAMAYVPDQDSYLRVEVALGHSCASEKEAEAIMHAIFALSDQDLLDSVPVYWKSFVAATTGLKWEDKEPPPPQGVVTPGEPGATMPRAIYTPEPEFTQQARKYRIQGSVVLAALVNESGTVERIRIVKPAGMGLDEAAVAIMPKWKFDPALREGKPVSAAMKLEVTFNLFYPPR